MKPGTRILLALRNFWKKYWKYIVIVAVIWIGIIIINNYLKNLPEENIVANTYTPDLPVMDTGEVVPEEEREEVNLVIDTFLIIVITSNILMHIICLQQIVKNMYIVVV